MLAQTWRANTDVQYLIHQTDPNIVDAEDVARVVNYIVAYACKGNKKEIDRKKSIAAMIMSAREETYDRNDVK